MSEWQDFKDSIARLKELRLLGAIVLPCVLCEAILLPLLYYLTRDDAAYEWLVGRPNLMFYSTIMVYLHLVVLRFFIHRKRSRLLDLQMIPEGGSITKNFLRLGFAFMTIVVAVPYLVILMILNHYWPDSNPYIGWAGLDLYAMMMLAGGLVISHDVYNHYVLKDPLAKRHLVSFWAGIPGLSAFYVFSDFVMMNLCFYPIFAPLSEYGFSSENASSASRPPIVDATFFYFSQPVFLILWLLTVKLCRKWMAKRQVED